MDRTFAMFDGPRSPLTQSFGLGMSGAPTPIALDEIESFFSSRDADTMHETCPLADRLCFGSSPIAATGQSSNRRCFISRSAPRRTR